MADKNARKPVNAVPRQRQISSTNKVYPKPPGEWTYDERDPVGPSKWKLYYPDCEGKRQSPIDIDTSLTRIVHFENICLTNLNDEEEDLILEHTGKTANFHLKPGHDMVQLSRGGLHAVYTLSGTHFHWGDEKTSGSEHTLNGRRYPAEMHMVFLKEGYTTKETASEDADGAAALAFFLELQGDDNHLLDPIIDALPKIAKPKTNTTVRGPLKFQSLIWPPIHGVFYEYRGSLTTPPCSEVDTWLVFEQPIGISRRQLSQFLELRNLTHPDEPLKHNYRPLQEHNGRRLFKNIPDIELFKSMINL